MAEQKTKATKASVRGFIAAVPNAQRRSDAETLLKLFEKKTGWKARMWGPTIVGFGRYEYTYDSGHSGVAPVCGFSPRKANLVIYTGGSGLAKRDALLKKLGRHKSGVGCVYINKLEDVDLQVLSQLIELGVAATKKAWTVSAS